MQYITSIERIGIKKGLEQGLERGIERGLEKGRHTEASTTLLYFVPSQASPSVR